MQRILISVILLVFSSNVFAVEVFQGLHVGDSAQTILKKYPNAIKNTNTLVSKEPDNQLYLKEYNVFGNDAELVFSLMDKGLVSVFLYFKKPQKVWAAVFQALTSKYGKPYINYNPSFRENLTVWESSDGVQITLQESNNGSLTISYVGYTAHMANKL